MVLNPELQKFYKNIEEYYGVAYRPTMKKALNKILSNVPGDYLRELFKYIRMSISADYKSVPDEKAIRECMREVDEAYPEFRATSHNRISHTRAQITDEAGTIPAALGRQYIDDIMAAFRNDEIRPVTQEPRDDDTRMTPYDFEQQWKKEHGVS